jgi:hypothetical protein
MSMKGMSMKGRTATRGTPVGVPEFPRNPVATPESHNDTAQPLASD